jgi:hypothetical protein
MKKTGVRVWNMEIYADGPQESSGTGIRKSSETQAILFLFLLPYSHASPPSTPLVSSSCLHSLAFTSQPTWQHRQTPRTVCIPHIQLLAEAKWPASNSENLVDPHTHLSPTLAGREPHLGRLGQSPSLEETPRLEGKGKDEIR